MRSPPECSPCALARDAAELDGRGPAPERGPDETPAPGWCGRTQQRAASPTPRRSRSPSPSVRSERAPASSEALRGRASRRGGRGSRPTARSSAGPAMPSATVGSAHHGARRPGIRPGAPDQRAGPRPTGTRPHTRRAGAETDGKKRKGGEASTFDTRRHPMGSMAVVWGLFHHRDTEEHGGPQRTTNAGGNVGSPSRRPSGKRSSPQVAAVLCGPPCSSVSL